MFLNVLYFMWGGSVDSDDMTNAEPVVLGVSDIAHLRLLSEMDSSAENGAISE